MRPAVGSSRVAMAPNGRGLAGAVRPGWPKILAVVHVEAHVAAGRPRLPVVSATGAGPEWRAPEEQSCRSRHPPTPTTRTSIAIDIDVEPEYPSAYPRRLRAARSAREPRSATSRPRFGGIRSRERLLRHPLDSIGAALSSSFFEGAWRRADGRTRVTAGRREAQLGSRLERTVAAVGHAGKPRTIRPATSGSPPDEVARRAIPHDDLVALERQAHLPPSSKGPSSRTTSASARAWLASSRRARRRDPRPGAARRTRPRGDVDQARARRRASRRAPSPRTRRSLGSGAAARAPSRPPTRPKTSPSATFTPLPATLTATMREHA